MLFKLFNSSDELENLLQNNQPRHVVAGQRNICVVRQGTNLIAFENECPHMGESLSGGLVNGLNEIVCPLHTYKFNLKTGEEESRRCASLKFIHVKNEGGEIYLELD